MQTYSYELIHLLSSEKIQAINTLFTERFNNAEERLIEHGVRFFKEVREDGSLYFYAEDDLPAPLEDFPFEQVPFSEYKPVLEAELHFDSACELFSEWEAQELKESSYLVDPFAGKIALTDDDLPF